jgi:1,4-dihydroxy-2-naphthoate octaprenyltransferase
MILTVWLRIIRIKFLLASIIGITVALLFSFYSYGKFDMLSALLTYIGVIFLHASVDLFNDYWDYKRGIDTTTTRTKYSGGTGVLPEKKLAPKDVYNAGLFFMIVGLSIGGYFVIQNGIIIAVILAIAVFSIYFYSTKIVNVGLGETLVAIKGCMVVVGTSYVQTEIIASSIVLLGFILGMLSSLVLFVASFPDHDADKVKGRKTLVILLGREKASIIFPCIFGAIYALTVIGIFMNYIPVFALSVFITIPFAIKAVTFLKDGYNNTEKTVNSISNTITFSRLFGVCLCLTYVFGIFFSLVKQ